MDKINELKVEIFDSLRQIESVQMAVKKMIEDKNKLLGSLYELEQKAKADGMKQKGLSKKVNKDNGKS